MRRFVVGFIGLAALFGVAVAHAATLEQLINIQKDVGAYEAQLTEDPVDVSGLAAAITEQGNPAILPEKTATGTLREITVLDKRFANILVVQIGAQQLIFKDVPRASWFAPYVRAAAEQGIIGGYKDSNGKPTGEFKPENPVSIEELAKMSVVAAYMDEQACPKSKNPTASGSWSLQYVGCAESKAWGVYGDATVDVKRPATRAEVVFTVLQALGAQGAAQSGSGWTTGFSDVPSTMPFAVAIARAKEDNIVSGYADDAGMPTGIFGPTDPVKRAEIAKIISLAMQVYMGR